MVICGFTIGFYLIRFYFQMMPLLPRSIHPVIMQTENNRQHEGGADIDAQAVLGA